MGRVWRGRGEWGVLPVWVGRVETACRAMLGLRVRAIYLLLFIYKL